MHIKAIVPGTEGMTHPDSRRAGGPVPPLCLRRTANNSRWYLSHCAPEGGDPHPGHS